MLEQNEYNIILSNFPKETIKLDIVKSLLITRPIVKLDKEITTGNHRVYKVNISGDIEYDEKEQGMIFVCENAGIAEHLHSIEKGVYEIYKSLGKNKFSWKGITYDQYVCLLGESHGVDIAETNRVLLYEKSIIQPKEHHKLAQDIKKLIK